MTRNSTTSIYLGGSSELRQTLEVSASSEHIELVEVECLTLVDSTCALYLSRKI
jgi:hypothetical protein